MQKSRESASDAALADQQETIVRRMLPTRVARLAGRTGIGRRPCHCPAQLREEPDGGLLDRLVFGAGVGAHFKT
jgi:hypothetical protein